MDEISIATVRALVDENVTDGMRKVFPQWLLNLGDSLAQTTWALPFSDLEAAAKCIFEDEFGRGNATKRIHVAFWTEYQRASETCTQFRTLNAISGVCSVQALVRLCEIHQELVAWLLSPPNTYNNRLLEISLIGEERMLQIMEASPVHPNGKVDSKLALAQIKLWELLQDRLHGSVAQNINQKSVNVNVNQNAPSASRSDEKLTPSQIMDRLAAIKQRVEQLTSPAPIRVDAKQIQPNMVKDDE